MKKTIKHRFKRLLQKADMQDEGLSQNSRKVKWVAILGTLFTLYLVSFLLPQSSLNTRRLDKPIKGNMSDSLNSDSTKLPSHFELPVDSFEQLLNQHIHEDTH